MSLAAIQQQAAAAAYVNQSAAAYATVQWYQPVTTATTTTTTTMIVNTANATGGTFLGGASAYLVAPNPQQPSLQGPCTFDLPDGAQMVIDDLGNYTINDANAKVVYRASRVRDFNPFLNASDLMEEYIESLVPQGITQDQVLHLEIEHFIYWLVCKTAERDNDPVPPPTDFPQLPDLRTVTFNQRFPRCRACGRFIRRAWAAAAINFCSPIHMERAMARIS